MNNLTPNLSKRNLKPKFISKMITKSKYSSLHYKNSNYQLKKTFKIKKTIFIKDNNLMKAITHKIKWKTQFNLYRFNTKVKSSKQNFISRFIFLNNKTNFHHKVNMINLIYTRIHQIRNQSNKSNQILQKKIKNLKLDHPLHRKNPINLKFL